MQEDNDRLSLLKNKFYFLTSAYFVLVSKLRYNSVKVKKKKNAGKIKSDALKQK